MLMCVALTLIAIACAQIPGEQPDAAKALMQLQGTWKFIGGEEAGGEISAEEARKDEEFFTFKGELLVIRHRGKVRHELAVSVKPGKGKGEIDFKHKGGNYDGKTCHAIYIVEGDVLKICTASKMRDDASADRPTVFSTKEKERGSGKIGTLLFILKRETK
jgi:uncharacterized protein (TIGR03067 family)